MIRKATIQDVPRIAEIIVFGKRVAYRPIFNNAVASLNELQVINLIEEYRSNPASVDNMLVYNRTLFVSLNKPHSRLTESGVELRLREMGNKLSVEKVHPHKFRRTMATGAIEKGMPIEQVQKILGHEQIDTTLRYAMVNQNNIKLSHRKYIS